MARQQQDRPWQTAPARRRPRTAGQHAFYVTDTRTGTVRIHRTDDPDWTPPVGSIAQRDQRAAGRRARRWIPGLARYDDQRRRAAARRLRAQTSAIRRARAIATGKLRVDPITRWWVTRQADRQLARIGRAMERVARPSLTQRVRRAAARQIRAWAAQTRSAVVARVQRARAERDARLQAEAAARRAAELATALEHNRQQADAQLARDLAAWDACDPWASHTAARVTQPAPVTDAGPDIEGDRLIAVVQVRATTDKNGIHRRAHTKRVATTTH